MIKKCWVGLAYFCLVTPSVYAQPAQQPMGDKPVEKQVQGNKKTHVNIQGKVSVKSAPQVSVVAKETVKPKTPINTNGAKSKPTAAQLTTKPTAAQLTTKPIVTVKSAPQGAALLAQETSKPATPIAPTDAKSKPTSSQPVNEINASYGFNIEQHYFNWYDDLGNRGSQFIAPVTFTVNYDKFDFGLRTAYINSAFDGGLFLDGIKIGTRKGQVSTLSDTSLSFAYTFKDWDTPLRLNLDLNVPTGKATLIGDQRNAIMDGALVQQTRFGEGFNVAPGFSVTRNLGNGHTIGAGASYIMRGQFDPNGDVINDEIKPGNDLTASLQYQYAGSDVLLTLGTIFTNSGTTKRVGVDYYKSGDRFDINANLAFVPDKGQLIRLSARYFTQTPNDVLNFFTGSLQKESANSNGNSTFVSIDWGIALDPEQKHTLHFIGDYLGVESNSYDPINDLFNAGRRRIAGGIGYEYAVSRASRFLFQAKYFNVFDRATAFTQRNVTADGINLFATFNLSF